MPKVMRLNSVPKTQKTPYVIIDDGHGAHQVMDANYARAKEERAKLANQRLAKMGIKVERQGEKLIATINNSRFVLKA